MADCVRKIDLMHSTFGKREDHTCGECNNCVQVCNRGKTRWKCQVYGTTSNEASDWTKRWTACGMFNRDCDKILPIIRLVRRGGPQKKQPDVPLDGQIKLEI